MTNFELHHQVQDLSIWTKKIQDPRGGAVVTFEGRVRNHNESKPVEALEYEIYHALASKEGQKILDEALERYDIYRIASFHLEGRLQIEKIAVWVGACAAHRDEAFRACRFVIDEIKRRLPIWKKEHYLGHPHQWINCQGCQSHHELGFSAKDFYSKQTDLRGMSEATQDRLAKSKVLVVGAGGLGSPALQYLAGAGIGKITIVDPDRLEASNLHRQTLYRYRDIGQYKAELAKQRLLETNPFIEVRSVIQALDFENAEDLLKGHDLALDCADNFTVSFALNDACHFAKTPLIQASIHQWDGQVQLIDTARGSACLRCYQHQIPQEGCVGNCAESGVVGAIPGIIGTAQALLAIQKLSGLDIDDHLRLFDLQTLRTRTISKPPQRDCPLCGSHPQITGLVNPLEPEEIDLNQLSLEDAKNYRWVDIREPIERRSDDPAMDDWNMDLLTSSQQPIALVCAKGIRSLVLAKKLRLAGHQNVYSAAGGVPRLKNFLTSTQ